MKKLQEQCIKKSNSKKSSRKKSINKNVKETSKSSKTSKTVKTDKKAKSVKSVKSIKPIKKVKIQSPFKKHRTISKTPTTMNRAAIMEQFVKQRKLKKKKEKILNTLPKLKIQSIPIAY